MFWRIKYYRQPSATACATDDTSLRRLQGAITCEPASAFVTVRKHWRRHAYGCINMRNCKAGSWSDLQCGLTMWAVSQGLLRMSNVMRQPGEAGSITQLRRDVLLTYCDGFGTKWCTARGLREIWKGVALPARYRSGWSKQQVARAFLAAPVKLVSEI